jgi:hypothetical protein
MRFGCFRFFDESPISSFRLQLQIMATIPKQTPHSFGTQVVVEIDALDNLNIVIQNGVGVQLDVGGNLFIETNKGTYSVDATGLARAAPLSAPITRHSTAGLPYYGWPTAAVGSVTLNCPPPPPVWPPPPVYIRIESPAWTFSLSVCNEGGGLSVYRAGSTSSVGENDDLRGKTI